MPPPRSDGGHAPETSVIIRTFNEAQNLPVLLDALGRQRYRDFEIVVVDSGSVDTTRDIARHAGVRLVCIDRNQFTFGYSLNAGIRAASGRLLAIVSAHAFPLDEHWLDALIRPLQSEQVAMVYGRQVGAAASKYSEARDFQRLFGSRRRDLKPPHMFANNANAAIRRELWEQYPFDQALPGLEDADWAKYWVLRDYRVVYEPDAAVSHVHRETWQQVQHRYYREAVAAKRIGLMRKSQAVTSACREALWAMSDACHAIADGSGPSVRPLVSRLREIAAFRYYKTAGTVQGLLDGDAQDQQKHAALYFESSYDAVVIEGPGRASLQRMPMPEVRPDDVLIKVAYVGVCGTDLEIVDGTLGYFSNGLGAYPIVPGHEMSGEVVAVGAKADHVKTGDRVVAECIQSCGDCDACLRDNPIACSARKELGVLRLNGAYAGYVRVPSRFVHVLPDELALDRAALCEPTAVVLKGIERLEGHVGRTGAPPRSAVVGAGPLGRLCALTLQHYGHLVTVYDRDPRRVASLSSCGLQGRVEFDGLDGFDILVEATGATEALDTILERSAPGSTILLLGLPYAGHQFSFENLVAYDKTVIGSVGSGARHFRRAIELLPQLCVAPLIENVLPLSSYAEGWKRFRDHDCVKMLLRVS